MAFDKPTVTRTWDQFRGRQLDVRAQLIDFELEHAVIHNGDFNSLPLDYQGWVDGHFEWENVRAERANARGHVLTWASFKSCDFAGSDFSEAVLNQSILNNSSFYRANLIKARGRSIRTFPSRWPTASTHRAWMPWVLGSRVPTSNTGILRGQTSPFQGRWRVPFRPLLRVQTSKASTFATPSGKASTFATQTCEAHLSLA